MGKKAGRKNTAYEVEKRRAKIARYFGRNYTAADIAPLVGVTASQVYKDYRKWREQRIARLRKDHDAAFVETLNGYDEAIRAAWDGMLSKDPRPDPGERAAFIREIGKLIQGKARLMGLVGGADGTSTTNILAIVHPAAAEEMARLMSPEQAAEIEAAVIEGEYTEVSDDADSG